MPNNPPEDQTHLEKKAADEEPPRISEHDLLRCIGEGSYGKVWLARNVIGTYRAVKIIYRKTFDNDQKYEREFLAIKKCEPICRMHEGVVHILQIGRNDLAGYFYYVMEVADDVIAGQAFDWKSYAPKTLSSEIRRRGRLPVDDCLHIGLTLTAALEHFHKHGLIHRDIKPSNIIFIDGSAKFADIGLVTDISEAATWLGSPGYMAPERPGSPAADIYSLGKVLYEMFTGRSPEDFPVLPTDFGAQSDISLLNAFNAVTLRACEINPRHRFQSAQAMHEQLTKLADGQASAKQTQGVARARKASSSALRVVILYRSECQPDEHLLNVLHEQLTRHHCQVFIDKHLAIGVDWAREIEKNIREADAAIVLLSARSLQSEMVSYEVEIAHESAQHQKGKPRLLPIRVAYAGALTEPLGRILNPLQHCRWESLKDDQRVVDEVIDALQNPPSTKSPALGVKLESVGGAVPLDSRFYVVRSSDQEFKAAIVRQDSIVLVKGARQMGKTSLLARGLQQAREGGMKVVLTDFQVLNTTQLESPNNLFLTLGEWIATQLDLDVMPHEVWNPRSGPSINFQTYLRRNVLAKLTSPLVWGLDEVDRLFTCSFGSEVFGLFRSLHNARSLDPASPWDRLTLAIAYATEAHLFITDVNQSPFNVGTRLTLEDFTSGQVADLNQRYGSPLRSKRELSRFFQLVSGHPYLVRRGLHELVTHTTGVAELVTQADHDEGIFGDHLRRILVLLAKDHDLCEIVRGVLQGRPCPTAESFYRLRTAGILTGDSTRDARFRCQLYASYLRHHLL